MNDSFDPGAFSPLEHGVEDLYDKVNTQYQESIVSLKGLQIINSEEDPDS